MKTTRVGAFFLATLALIACGDQAMRAAGDAMVGVGDAMADMLRDGGQDVRDAADGRAEAQVPECGDCGRMFEVLAEIPLREEMQTETFDVTGFDRIHVGTADCGRAAYVSVQARFGTRWVTVFDDAGHDPSVRSFFPVADEYRLVTETGSSNCPDGWTVVHGERTVSR